LFFKKFLVLFFDMMKNLLYFFFFLFFFLDIDKLYDPKKNFKRKDLPNKY